MVLAVLTLAVVAVVVALYQVMLTIVFFVQTRRRRTTDDADELPKAAILLALRGADPDLARGLKGLMEQDYPDYELHIVVDSETDPAWDVVRRSIEETAATNVRVSPLRERPAACSLHCASLVQLAGELDESTELFVLADGDIVAHASWLRELVTPIVQGQAEATSGHRWYAPPRGRFGSILRYVWNAAAVVAMSSYGIPWGGTFAARTGDLHRSGLTDKWKKALAVDAPIHDCWRRLGLRIRFVPSLMMINREECGLAGAFAFLSRQLTWSRLYQPRLFWHLIVVHAGVVSAILWALLGVSICAVLTGAGGVAATALGSLLCYLGAMTVSLFLLERCVRAVARRKGEAVRWLSAGVLLKVIVAIPVTQMVHLMAVVRVMTRRQLNWRGVVYDIRSPFDVRIVDDRPLPPSDRTVDSACSL